MVSAEFSRPLPDVGSESFRVILQGDPSFYGVRIGVDIAATSLDTNHRVTRDHIGEPRAGADGG